jgi:NAD(P)-dependent dehydrogenase (short-subunit alcohol dehydrogenase family)
MDAVITGASTGIGRATALRLHGEGWRVFAGVRRASDGDGLVAEASAQQAADASERLVPVIIDVTDAGGVRKAADTVRGSLGPAAGRLNGLVNNAGIGISGPIEFVSLDDWRRQLEVNVIGQVAVTQAFLPLLRSAKGRIVNIGSIGGRSSTPFVGPYAASKYALEGINDALRRELRKWGMWVAIVEPGAIATPIWEKGRAEARAALDALPAAGRELYGRDLENVERTVERVAASGLPPEQVADAILHALTASRPRARYLIGREAKARVLAEALLPVRAFDFVIARAMGLGR